MGETALKIDWEKTPLIPVIVQDAESKDVLMLAYMNEEAFNLSRDTGYAHYYSRSRKRLWKKGESSGHTQEIVQMLLDCDADTLLLRVHQKGVACHTGRKSCFFTDIEKNATLTEPEVDTAAAYGVIDTLYHTILERKGADPDASYTAKLLQGKENSMLKKIVEEAGEFCFAVKDDDEKEIIYECADLVYHVLVALGKKEISPDRIRQELARRFGMSGIEEKNSRADD
ncbi:bifunctional phosphoribosyl-AMP cyclohydrolase/phosphoribosyl-ATP diphosphatase HisIE [Hydrogenimonas urashimensis]|uniref:bifunctional phosphoribosyl-AMP cyclohydrolase/phosphoribosyl-ATP diphosphatase HisIE n=1 Tax=Hydrogenimonas urashimensis TaxID=2740515 RepID=UPI0019151A83|nr:bifunctional phosphoribosyl-AMP cyclohydrolase/phosphoribosyl-ATP diphosphatase HisIE [Hydrogenimonas urashimensis]